MVKTRKNRKLRTRSRSRRTRNYRKKLGGAAFGSGGFGSGFAPGSLSGPSYAGFSAQPSGFGSRPLPTGSGFFSTDPAIAHMMVNSAAQTQEGARAEAQARQRALEARARGERGFGTHNRQSFGAAGGIMGQPAIISGFGGPPVASFGAQRGFGGLPASSFGAPASAHFGMSGYERPQASVEQLQGAQQADAFHHGAKAHTFRTQGAQFAALNQASQPGFRHIGFETEAQARERAHAEARAQAQIKPNIFAGQSGKPPRRR